MSNGPDILLDPEAYLAEMERGFMTCAIWTDVIDFDEPDERGISGPQSEGLAFQQLNQVDAESRSHVLEFCSRFMLDNRVDLAAAATMNADGNRTEWTDGELAGHDLWLTCGGHGAGFWDRGYGTVGDRLSDWCRTNGGLIEFGMSPFYEDDHICFEPLVKKEG